MYNGSILVVDDNEHNLFSFRTLLENEGWLVETCHSGEAALERLMHSHQISLILMDVQMPEMDGFETANLITQNPLCKDIPILFISAVHSSDAFVEHGFAVGAYDYLVKPVEEFLLLNKIRIFTTLYHQQKTIEQAHARVMKTEKKFRSMFEFSPVATLLLDHQGMSQCNKAATVLFEGDTTHTTHDYDLLHLSAEGAQAKPLLEQHLQQAYEQGDYAYHWQCKTLRGAVFPAWVKLKKVPLENHEALLVMVTDLTLAEEKEALEKALRQEERLKSLGLLAGGVAHDFNNLLMPIIANTEQLLRDSEKASAEAPLLHDILIASEKASALSQQMLAYSGSSRLSSTVVDLGQSILAMQNSLYALFTSQIIFDFNFAESLPKVDVDIEEIERILRMLLKNSVDALGCKVGHITVSTLKHSVQQSYIDDANSYCMPELAMGEYVAFVVEDDGCGISAETQQHIFDPFFSTKHMARGLSMATVLGVVRSHKGILHIDSSEGRGTKMTVSLPVPAKPLATTLGDQDFHESSQKKIEGSTILIIDDDPIVGKIIAMYLKKMGCQSLQAFDGQEGLVLFQENSEIIDGVVLDMNMPVMTGDQCFIRLKEIDPHVKVILSSGFAPEDLEPIFKDQGLAGFLKKPYRFHTFESEVSYKIFGICV